MKVHWLAGPIIATLALALAACSAGSSGSVPPTDEPQDGETAPFNVVHVEEPAPASDPALVASAVAAYQSLLPELDSYALNECPIGTVEEIVEGFSGDFGGPFATTASTGGISCIATSVAVNLFDAPVFEGPGEYAANYNYDTIDATAELRFFDGDMFAYCPPTYESAACGLHWWTDGLAISLLMAPSDLSNEEKIQDLVRRAGEQLPTWLSQLAASGR